jgi:hypothetical protein
MDHMPVVDDMAAVAIRDRLAAPERGDKRSLGALRHPDRSAPRLGYLSAVGPEQHMSD